MNKPIYLGLPILELSFRNCIRNSYTQIGLSQHKALDVDSKAIQQIIIIAIINTANRY